MKARQRMNIQSIQTAIDVLGAEYNAKVLPLRQALKTEFNAVFDADTELQAVLKALDESTDYIFDEFGELNTWVRIDRAILKKYHDLNVDDHLADYLMDDGIQLDIKDECVMRLQGTYIGINEDGDVYLEDGETVWIVNRSEYESIEERNALIKAHMEKAGHYPAVVKVGRYGDIEVVSTQPVKMQA